MKRPVLREIDIRNVLDKPSVLITMSRGQWDPLLEAAYDAGHILIELDENEVPARAFRRADAC